MTDVEKDGSLILPLNVAFHHTGIPGFVAKEQFWSGPSDLPCISLEEDGLSVIARQYWYTAGKR